MRSAEGACFGATRHVETGLGPLLVTEAGQGPETMVLWPSIFTDHHIYAGLVDRLGQRCRMLLVDGPGHGGSPGRPRPFAMRDCAAALAEVMTAHGVERGIVGGTSWGGLAAAELALAEPRRVAALVLLNTPMLIDGERPGLSARMIALGARWMLASRLFRDGVARAFFAPGSLARNEAYARQFHAMLRGADPACLAAAVRSVILAGTPLMRRLATIGAPTLVIAGEDDDMYPMAVQADAARLLPKGHFVSVPGRHISAVDAPDAVVAALGRFLDACGAKAAA